MTVGAFYRSIARKVRKQYSLRALRRRAYDRQGGKCFWCGEQMLLPIPEHQNDPRCLSADHYPISVYEGGRTEPSNIVAACRECNSMRNHELNLPPANECTWSAGNDLPDSPFELLQQMLDMSREDNG